MTEWEEPWSCPCGFQGSMLDALIEVGEQRKPVGDATLEELETWLEEPTTGEDMICPACGGTSFSSRSGKQPALGVVDGGLST